MTQLADDVEEAKAQLYLEQARKLRIENDAAEGIRRRGHDMNIKGGLMVENDMKQPSAQEELAYINQFTKSPLTAEEVYFFPVRLCDNAGGPGF